ncbi:uncharacterized protein LAESUDRAFT_559923 [Laetiporus sulphureus 93-53]|uniref:Defective in cullin neddylation protein n=1 Tax=Laetiporus sulphureus 93-53 TaxID=1314785 RepID=A0A165B5C8_9APHY|nr:uncharacterized protein LAESUDRAFT_559923 [Laetiporus sulphureus 93-53]KZT00275.1 hypothetical protein LAESUDRAFT_559923 [Laetiporus sulphureus 93-53]
MGEWSRKGWVDGWKALGCDSISAMKSTLPRLRDKLGSDPEYFRRVYNFTFDFSRPAGQRSLGESAMGCISATSIHSHIGLDMAEAFWALLIPHGLRGGALSHLRSGDGEEEGAQTAEEEGWKEEYTQWWFDFLNEKGGRGVSKDTWQMVRHGMSSRCGKFPDTQSLAGLVSRFCAHDRREIRKVRYGGCVAIDT